MTEYLVAFGAAALMAAPSFAQTSPNADAAAPGADAPKPRLEASRSAVPAAEAPGAPKPAATNFTGPSDGPFLIP